MPKYNVSFFKNLQNSQGHCFKCLQQVIAVRSNSREEAVAEAQQQFERQWRLSNWRLHADTVEAIANEETG